MTKIEDKLNDCLERMSKGAGIGECVSLYPDDREELLPLLETAASSIIAANSVESSPGKKAIGLSRLLTAMQEQSVPKRKRFGWTTIRPRILRPVAFGFIFALLATGTALGTASAAGHSMPGEPFYWVKTASESISLLVPQSEMSKAQKHVSIAMARSLETERLMATGRYRAAEQHMYQIHVHLKSTAGLIGVRLTTNALEMPSNRAQSRFREDIPTLRRHLRRDNRTMKSTFERHLSSIPHENRRRIIQFMTRRELMYRSLIAALENNGPSTWVLSIPSSQRTPKR